MRAFILLLQRVLSLVLIAATAPCFAQQAPAPKPMEQSGMGGNAMAGTFAPVYDSAHRPITAGGFVDSGPAIFADISKSSGLAAWKHVMGTPNKKYILETDGSGVGLIDYDN